MTDQSNIFSSEIIKHFKLIIFVEKWEKIKPTGRTNGRNNRKYMTLQAGKWTNVFADKIWQQIKLPCAFSFKRAKVYCNSDAKCYVKFKGMCNECGAQLVDILYNKPLKKSDVVFDCKLAGFRTDIIHKKKRQLKGSLREKIASELLDENKAANAWRNKEANKIMTFGDDIPPILYDSTVLRKAKQMESDKRLELQNSNPIKNLQIAKCMKFYRTICCAPVMALGTGRYIGRYIGIFSAL